MHPIANEANAKIITVNFIIRSKFPGSGSSSNYHNVVPGRASFIGGDLPMPMNLRSARGGRLLTLPNTALFITV